MSAVLDWIWLIIMAVATYYLLFAPGGLFRRAPNDSGSDGNGGNGGNGGSGGNGGNSGNRSG